MFLDTNVAASALASRGRCAAVLDLVLERHRLLASDEVEAELTRALTRKFRLPGPLAVEVSAGYCRTAERVSSLPAREIPHPDPADRAVLSAAWNGEADVLVTGDTGVRALRRVGRVLIMTPREFWEATRPEAVGEGR